MNVFFYDTEKALISFAYMENFQVCIKPELFKVILWNLIRNALFFIKQQNKGTITIWSEVKPDEACNNLYFRDTALGISEESMENIFEPFYTNRKGGTGLGLFFCKFLIEVMGGTISCSGEPGRHIVFTLSFPKVC